MDQIPLKLNREGIKEKEDGGRGGWGLVGNYSKDGYYLRKYGDLASIICPQILLPLGLVDS